MASPESVRHGVEMMTNERPPQLCGGRSVAQASAASDPPRMTRHSPAMVRISSRIGLVRQTPLAGLVRRASVVRAGSDPPIHQPDYYWAA